MKEVKSTIIACFITRFRNGIFTLFIYFCVLSPEALYCPYIYIIQFPLFPILHVYNFILISRSRLNFDLPPCLGNIKMIIYITNILEHEIILKKLNAAADQNFSCSMSEMRTFLATQWKLHMFTWTKDLCGIAWSVLWIPVYLFFHHWSL